ncbi:MAG: acylhydrolase [Bacteroidales bacterium]|nr:acylhydrolase [Bacteroidales bacterium]
MRFLASLAVLLFMCPALIQAQAKEDKDWALYSRYSGANDTITVAPKVVFMGNSITENWLKFHPEFFQKNVYAARGISGQTTYEMLARFHNDVVALGPQAVVILSGINDIARNSGYISLENIMGNIISMCDIARANGIVPILCSILPADRFSWRKDLKPAPLVVEMNKLIKGYADTHGLQYVDFYTPLADENGALREGLSKDRCHPYPEVYTGMEEQVQDAIAKALKGSKKKKNRK